MPPKASEIGVWKDCFEQKLGVGEDVIVAILEHDSVELHSGIVIDISDDRVWVSFNGFYPDGCEYEGTYFATIVDFPDRVAKTLYRLREQVTI